MNVGVKIFRHIVVYNVRNTLNVDTTRGDIGSDKNSVTTILKAVERLLSLPLREISVKRRDVLPLASELLR
jgi:hypothetical protein